VNNNLKIENMENSFSRREFIKVSALTTAGVVAANTGIFATPHGDPNFKLPPMLYDFKALEPHIDAMTMEIHYSKHHQGYVDNLNKLCSDMHIHDPNLENILKMVSKFPQGVRNNAGGHWNHSMFWTIMKPNGGGVPKGKLLEAINASFESFEKFKELFSNEAKNRFGSGWAWLIKNSEGKLQICSTPNQDNPIMDLAEVKGNPILCLDVWEHAYYLKYQNKRLDYINAWWNVVNWDMVAGRFSI
jgi:Fe-Mn family superoxide dismutase